MTVPADCCPECLTPVEPVTVRTRGETVEASYWCPSRVCGHKWTTGWLLDALGDAA